MATNYTGPITTVNPESFAAAGGPTGVAFTLTDGRQLSFADILTYLRGEFDGSETIIQGVNVSGSGTTPDPYVIEDVPAEANVTLVRASTPGVLPQVGAATALYLINDKDGNGTPGLWWWDGTTNQYIDPAPNAGRDDHLGNADLTLDADRTHNLAANELRLRNGTFELDDVQFIVRDASGGRWRMIINSEGIPRFVQQP